MISINATFILTILNFIVLVAVLSVILWKPMLKFLDKRVQTINDSLKLAEENNKRSEEIKVEYDKMIKEARTKATEIIDKAMLNASDESREIVSQAKGQAQTIVDSARDEILIEAERIKHDLRKEMASMTVSLASKVLGREIKAAEHKLLIDKNLDVMGI
ncbi:F0F1 ATP synthase subunit B [Candidatus Latescibacterota bacterium]